MKQIGAFLFELKPTFGRVVGDATGGPVILFRWWTEAAFSSKLITLLASGWTIGAEHQYRSGNLLQVNVMISPRLIQMALKLNF